MSYTPNLAFPLLFSAQAQKEITHNEALVLIDALLPGAVLALANDPSGFTPVAGQAWIIGTAPVGEWAGQASKIAVYSEGGWRFTPPVAGMRLLDHAENLVRRYDGTAWIAASAIAAPSGGGSVDAEARATLGEVLTAMRQAGLLPVT